MRVEITSRISTNYEQVVLFLLKRNRNSLRNSSAQCISLQSLWSSTVLPSIPLLLKAVCALHLTEPSLCLTPHPPFYLHPRVKHSPICPVLSAHFGAHPEACLPSPLCRALCYWEEESGSHRRANGQLATQPTLQRAMHFLGLHPGRKGCVQ